MKPNTSAAKPYASRDPCAILIVGAGPAGLSAALAAAPSGRSIVVLDDNPAPGGQVWRNGAGAAAPGPLQQLQEALARYPHVRLCCGTRVVAAQGSQALLLESANSAWVQGFEQLILCTGARELLLPFPGWTLPGVTGAGGLQALIKSGLPVRGQRIVIAGSGPLLLAAAASATKAGAQVMRVAEQSSWGQVAAFGAGLLRWPGKLIQAATLAPPAYRCDSYVLAAQGETSLQTVVLRQGAQTLQLDCDRLAVGFGLVPNVELGRLLGCATRRSAQGGLALQVDAQQATSVSHIFAAGECTGAGGAELAMAEGSVAGLATIGQQAAAAHLHARVRWQNFANRVDKHFALRPELRTLAQADTLLCRCEDVAYGNVAACKGWNDAKLHQRCGMGACQGRICGAAAQHLFGWDAPSPRPPLSPARVSTLSLAGDEGEALP
jgi:NADPH-dependent 2,4-dienoyl-CoA reductase/sulfur reductase-like enzyme